MVERASVACGLDLISLLFFSMDSCSYDVADAINPCVETGSVVEDRWKSC